MALTQRYGIKYPFLSDNDEGIFLDTNDSYKNSLISQLLHLVFTPKGQKLRDPNFGTDMIKYIFNPSDDENYSDIKGEISTQVSKYIPNIEFRNFDVYKDENDQSHVGVSIEFAIRKGSSTEVTTVAIKL